MLVVETIPLTRWSKMSRTEITSLADRGALSTEVDDAIG
jgi:hypothetical protein